MIVDMLRNDLGRIADTGSVEVDGLFEVERYPTLWQMTSTVRARTSAGVPEIFRALFPCASVTGAPKIRTMEIINELEAYPRGAYCGAIGWWGPGRRARFSVGIRTVTANRETGEAVYSVGSGITWDSLTDAEHDECRLKSKILTNSEPDFELIETIAWNDGYELFEEHLERLGASLRYFGFRGSLHPVRQRLADTARGLNGPTKVRVRVDRKGEVRIATHPLPKASVLRVGLATDPVDPNNRFLYHKTTNREMYEQARRTRPDLDDVILWNAAGEITETTIANVVVRFDGHWFTPPVASGLLPGVLRGALLREGEIAERVLHVADLDRAEEIRLINSVRGWMRIEWVPDRPASLARS